MLSLLLGKKTKSAAAPLPHPKPNAIGSSFGGDDNEEDRDNGLTLSSKPKSHITQATIPLRVLKKQMEKELKVDPSMYKYDRVYDQMKCKPRRIKRRRALRGRFVCSNCAIFFFFTMDTTHYRPNT